MSIRSFITNNFWTKLFSLVAAIIIWSTIRFAAIPNSPAGMSVNSAETETREFKNLPLNILTASEDPRGFQALPPVVSVVVSGDAKTIDRLTEADIGVFVNVNEATDPQSNMRRVHVDIPPGLTLVQLSPQAVRLDRSGTPTR